MPDGSEHYYENGELHRLDGLTIVKPNGLTAYFIRGARYLLKGNVLVSMDRTKEIPLKTLIGE